jgi:hypothetical protein
MLYQSSAGFHQPLLWASFGIARGVETACAYRTPDGLAAELDAFSDLAQSCCGFCAGPQPFHT